jgi:two-component system copper resistance phosphate regulon response regulator CusR
MSAAGPLREPPVRALYVEDDPVALQYVRSALSRRGFVVDTAREMSDGLTHAREGQHDVIIIDVMLPDGDGFDLLRALRDAGIDTPVLFLSARGEVADRLRGFDLGADDYLTKPFAMAELEARARAILRRRAGTRRGSGLRAFDLELDPEAHSVLRGGRRIDLPPKQYALLELLLENYGRVVRRRAIVERVWEGSEPRSNVLAVQVSALRRAVDHGFEPKLIHTVAGVGYMLEDRSRPVSLEAGSHG